MVGSHLIFAASALLVAGSEFYPSSGLHGVTELNPATFESLVAKGIDATGGKVFHVVKFYRSKGERKDADIARAKKARGHIAKAAKALRGTAAMVSALDISVEENLEVFSEGNPPDNSALPLVKIYRPDGTGKVYEGKLSKLGDFVAKQVEKYVGDDLENYMPVLSPKQKAYKSFKKDKKSDRVVLLFESRGKSKKKEAIYSAVMSLALNFKGKIRFGFSRHRKIARLMGLDEATEPTLTLVAKGQKLSGHRPYSGALAYAPLKVWLSQFVEPTPPPALPTPSAVNYVPRVASEACMERFCTGRGGFCVLSLLPYRSLSEKEALYYRGSINLVRRSLVDRLGLAAVNGMHFLEIDSGVHTEWVEQTFGLYAQEYARTLVWYPKKGVFSQYVGTFGPKDLATWLSSASRGKAKVLPMVSENVLPLFFDPDTNPDPGALSCDGEAPDPLPDLITADAFKTGKSSSSRKSSKNTGSDKRPEQAKAEKEAQDAAAYLSGQRLPRPKGKAGVSYDLGTAEVFDANVIASPSHWLVWFQGDAKFPTAAETDAWVKAAKSLKGMVQFGVVKAGKAEGADENAASLGTELLSAHGISYDGKASKVRLFPAKTLWGEAEGKVAASRWLDDLEAIETKALTEKALGLLSMVEGDGIRHVTAANFNAWYTPDSFSHLRLILFPSKDLDKTPYLLRAIAIEFPSILKVGLAKRSDKQFAEQFGVTEFPKLLIVSPQGPPDKKTGQVSLGAHIFPGSLSFNSVARYFESHVRVAPKETAPEDDAGSKDEL